MNLPLKMALAYHTMAKSFNEEDSPWDLVTIPFVCMQ